MKTIAVLSHKGGAGKTTVAVNLALAWRALGARVLLADVDPVRSASDTLRKRPDHASLVVETSAAKLAALAYVSAKSGCDVLIIDTPGGPDSVMIEAMKVADLCIAVSRPTYLDVAATLRTVDTVRRLGRQGMILFNQCPPRRNGLESAVVRGTMDVLRAGGLEVCPLALQARAVYQRAIAQGQSVGEYDRGGQAAAEIAGLLAHVQARIAGSARDRTSEAWTKAPSNLKSDPPHLSL